MEISLRQAGGLLGADRDLKISDRQVEVKRNGNSSSHELTDDEIATVDALASRVATTTPSATFSGDPFASDAMRTELEIGHGAAIRHYELQSGADAPPELWNLVSKLGEVADRARPAG